MAKQDTYDIRTYLDSFQNRYQITILYAGEVGSQLWGYAHPGSDWDIKFIYMHPIHWYLKLANNGWNTIEQKAVQGNKDFTGWDITKVLNLARTHNTQPYEWANAPGVHKTMIGAKYNIENEIRNYYEKYYCRKSFFHQYLHMTEKDYSVHVKQSESLSKPINHRKLLVTLRECLCTLWVTKYNLPPPLSIETMMLNFEDLGSQVYSFHATNKEICPAIRDLIEDGRENKQRNDLKSYKRVTSFIAGCLDYFPTQTNQMNLNHYSQDEREQRQKDEEANEIFRNILYHQMGMTP